MKTLPVRGSNDTPAAKLTIKAVFICGILSSMLYVAMNIVADVLYGQAGAVTHLNRSQAGAGGRSHYQYSRGNHLLQRAKILKHGNKDELESEYAIRPIMISARIERTHTLPHGI